MKGEDPIVASHKEHMRSFELPEWVFKQKCPFCGEVLEEFSIRGITFKFNTRNVGDISIEFACEKCKIGDSLYFRKEFENSMDIANIMSGAMNISESQPVTEEQMYGLSYNNAAEHMIENLGDKNGHI